MHSPSKYLVQEYSVYKFVPVVVAPQKWSLGYMLHKPKRHVVCNRKHVENVGVVQSTGVMLFDTLLCTKWFGRAFLLFNPHRQLGGSKVSLSPNSRQRQPFFQQTADIEKALCHWHEKKVVSLPSFSRAGINIWSNDDVTFHQFYIRGKTTSQPS